LTKAFDGIAQLFFNHQGDLNMKIIAVMGLALTGVVSMLNAGNVLAASNIMGGAACHHLEARNIGDIEYYQRGITNLRASTGAYVICPIAKNTADYKGVSVRINMDSAGANTVSCTLYSRNPNGSALSSKAARNISHGKESLLIRVASSTPRSYFSLICKLPGNEAAELFSVETLN
jgi:hypothetical protein